MAFVEMDFASGGKEELSLNPTFATQFSVNKTKEDITVNLQGTFHVNAQTSNNTIITNLPKPKSQITLTNAITLSTGAEKGDIVITTDGEAKAPKWPYFSAGYDWIYNISYPLV